MSRRNTAQLDLFDQRQGDLFLAPAAPAPPSLAADPACEHTRITALANAARIECLEWREGRKKGWGAGQSYFTLEWFEHAGRFYARRDAVLGTGGGGGPFREVAAADRNGLILSALRGELKGCAHAYAMRDWGSDGERRWAVALKLSRWAIDQCPALMFGADLAAEFEAMQAAAVAAEQERRQMLRDVEALRDQLIGALYAANGSEPPENASDWHIKIRGTPDDFGRADVQVQGDWPNRLRVMIYSARPHFQGAIDDMRPETPEQLETLQSALAKRMPCPVEIAPLPYQQAHYYPVARREITWPTDPARAYHLRVLGMEDQPYEV